MPVQMQMNTSMSLTNSGGQQYYKSLPTVFTDLLDSGQGPSPGLIMCSSDGTIIDLNALSSPGWCVFFNQNETNYVTIGLWNPTANVAFISLQEVIDSLSTIPCPLVNPYPDTQVCITEGEFYPIHEVGPQKFYIAKLSRLLGQIQTASGTGTAASQNTRLMIKASVGTCGVVVSAFES